MSNKIKQELEKIQIPSEIRERSHLGVMKARSERQLTKNNLILRNYKLTTGLIAALLLLTISVSPNFQAQAKETISNSLLWIKAATNLPIPEKWLPSEKELTHYYYEVTTTENGYSINLYWSEDFISLKEAQKLPIPLSASQYVGSIAAEKVENPTLEQLPALKENKEVILDSGTIAKGDAVGLRWTNKNWTYDIVGHNAIKYANEIDKMEKNHAFKEFEKGQIRVIIGNNVTTHISWIENNGYKYELQVEGDVTEAVSMFEEADRMIKTLE